MGCCCCCCFTGEPKWLPLLLALLMATGAIAAYVIAVINGDVYAIFPYISDTAVALPEACIFSFFYNLAGFTAFVIMYIKYKYTMNAVQDSHSQVTCLASANMVLASICCLGLLLTANFPEDKMEILHFTGAAMLFSCGVLYCVIDTWISYQMWPVWTARWLCAFRLCITMATIISFIIMGVSAFISYTIWSSEPVPIGETYLTWNSDDPGYQAHLASTFSEWFLAAFFLSYFLTITYEFKRISCELKIIQLPADQSNPAPPGKRATENTRLWASEFQQKG